MKKPIALLLAFLMLLTLGACGEKQPQTDPGETSAPSETQPAAVTPAHHMVTLAYTTADSLNPFQTKSRLNRDLSTLLYDSLVRLDETFMPVPSLASELTMDGTTITVTLREDARFTTGEMLHARDVTYSFQYAKESPLFAARLENIFSCTQSGEQVVFTLLDENVFAESCLDFPVVKFGTGEEDLPTGSGRYMLYHKDGDAYLRANADGSALEEMEQETIRLLDVSMRENELQLLQIGELSAYFVDPAARGRAKISANERSVPMLNLVYLGLNSSREHMSDPAFRRAIAAAIDKTALQSSAFDSYAEPTDTPFHPLWGAGDGAPVTFDPQSAANQFDMLGYSASTTGGRRKKNGVAVTLEMVVNSENAGRLRCAQTIRSALQNLGFAVNLSVLDYDSYLVRLDSGIYDLYLGEVKLTADMDLSMFFSPDGAAAYGLSGEGAAAQAYQSFIAGTVDPPTFAKVFAQDQPFVPLCFRSGILYCAKELHMEGGASENDLYANLYSWSF